MDNSIIVLKKDTKLAGVLFLLHIVAILYGVIFVYSILGISGTDEMANNFVKNEFLFRTGIVSRIFSLLPILVLGFILYRLFKNVNAYQAKFMLALLLISIPFQFIAEVFNITSLMIAKAELLKSIDTHQRQDFSVLFLHVYNNVVSIGQLFWGLWLFPFGLLIIRSKFIPQLFGTIVILGGVGYLIDYMTFLLFPHFRSITVIAMLVGFISEMAIMIWLLSKGVKNQF